MNIQRSPPIASSCNSFNLSYNIVENADMRIFGQISDLHQARMVREEREGLKKPNQRDEREQEQRKKGESLNWRTNSGCARCSLRGARPATSCHVMAVMRLRGRDSGRWRGDTDDDFRCGSLSSRRLSLAARSSVPSEGFGFVRAMG